MGLLFGIICVIIIFFTNRFAAFIISFILANYLVIYLYDRIGRLLDNDIFQKKSTLLNRRQYELARMERALDDVDKTADNFLDFFNKKDFSIFEKDGVLRPEVMSEVSYMAEIIATKIERLHQIYEQKKELFDSGKRPNTKTNQLLDDEFYKIRSDILATMVMACFQTAKQLRQEELTSISYLAYEVTMWQADLYTKQEHNLLSLCLSAKLYYEMAAKAYEKANIVGGDAPLESDNDKIEGFLFDITHHLRQGEKLLQSLRYGQQLDDEQQTKLEDLQFELCAKKREMEECAQEHIHAALEYLAGLNLDIADDKHGNLRLVPRT